MSKASTSRDVAIVREERENWYHIATTLIDHGTRALRKKFLEEVKKQENSPDALERLLEARRQQLVYYKDKIKLLNDQQWNLLYDPRNNSCAKTAEKFDITLLTSLFGIFLKIRPPPSTGKWNVEPNPADPSWQAAVLRLRYVRNQLTGHILEARLSNNDYLKARDIISQSVVKLGYKETLPTKSYLSSVSEDDLRKELEEIEKQLQELCENDLMDPYALTFSFKRAVHEIVGQRADGTDEKINNLEKKLERLLQQQQAKIDEQISSIRDLVNELLGNHASEIGDKLNQLFIAIRRIRDEVDSMSSDLSRVGLMDDDVEEDAVPDQPVTLPQQQQDDSALDLQSFDSQSTACAEGLNREMVSETKAVRDFVVKLKEELHRVIQQNDVESLATSFKRAVDQTLLDLPEKSQQPEVRRDIVRQSLRELPTELLAKLQESVFAHENLSMRLPPELTATHSDVLIMHVDGDFELAKMIKDYVSSVIVGDKCQAKATLQDDASPYVNSKIQWLDEALPFHTYVFAIWSPEFMKDSLAVFQTDAALCDFIDNRSKNGCFQVVLPSEDCRKTLPSLYRSIKAIELYGRREKWKDYVSNLIKSRIHQRLEREEFQLVDQIVFLLDRIR